MYVYRGWNPEAAVRLNGTDRRAVTRKVDALRRNVGCTALRCYLISRTFHDVRVF